jgi:sugar/nucleoside kinase (ribokinase family)
VVVEQIRVAPAGTAGGTAVDLARLGAEVISVGAVGEDHAGRFLRLLLEEEGIDTTALTLKPGVQTSASVLPISSAGVRPAWHVRGANALLGRDDLPWHRLAGLDALHYGGVSALPGLDGAVATELLEAARAAGVRTSADCLGIKRDDAMETLRPTLPHIDLFMPNRAEALTLTGRSDPREAARALLDEGAGAVIVKLDDEGCHGIGPDGEFTHPAFPVDVVDTTGCGDAFCAGTIRGLTLGRSLEEAAWLGTAAGALTAGGLGSDAGVRDLEGTLAFLESQRPSATEAR